MRQGLRQGQSFHDRQREELEMDNLLQAYGFSASAVKGQSPTTQHKQGGHMEKSMFVGRQDRRGRPRDQYLNQTLKLGAQGFQETDYTPTELQDSSQFRGMDMDLFPDLKSEHGVNSEIQRGNERQSVPEPHRRQKRPAEPAQNSMKTVNAAGRAPERNAEPERRDGTHGISIESILDPRAAAGASTYSVTMRIPYQTSLGESLCVVGDLEELGQWATFKCQMRWTEGHVWVLEGLQVKKPQFLYKYVLMKDERPTQWERGENRIADLRLLPESSPDGDILNQVLMMGDSALKKESSGTKNVEILDDWEQFTIKMQVFVPYKLQDAEAVYMSSSLSQLGSKSQPLKLAKSRQKHNPMVQESLMCKYGRTDLQPWECQVKLKSYDPQFKNVPVEVNYEYCMVDSAAKRQEMERRSYGARRRFRIQKPETYCDTITMVASVGVMNRQDLLKTWIINGQIAIQDGNYLGKDFSVTKIDDTGLWFGSYPADANDIQSIRQHGIKAVLNVQTEAELALREIDIKKIQATCLQYQIQFMRLPLKENDEGEYAFDLFRICQKINQIVEVEKKGPLLVHCTSGVTRSPTVALTYLCIFKKIEDWDNPLGFSNYLKVLNPRIFPNMSVVNRTINNNQNFIDRQKFKGLRSSRPANNSLQITESQPAKSPLKSARAQALKANIKINTSELNQTMGRKEQETELNYETSSEKGEVVEKGSVADRQQSSRQPISALRSPAKSSPRKSEQRSGPKSDIRSHAQRSQMSAPWEREEQDSADAPDGSPDDSRDGAPDRSPDTNRSPETAKRSVRSRQNSEIGNRSRTSAPWEQDDEASGSQSDNEIIKLIEKAEKGVPSNSLQDDSPRSAAQATATKRDLEQLQSGNDERPQIKPFYTNPKISRAAKIQQEEAYSKIKDDPVASVLQPAPKIIPDAPAILEPETKAPPAEVKASQNIVKKTLAPSSSARSLQRMEDIQAKYKELQEELLQQKKMNEELLKEQEQKHKIAKDLVEAEKQASEYKQILQANQSKTEQIQKQIEALKDEKVQVMNEMEMEKQSQAVIQQQKEEQEKMHRENTEKLLTKINMVEVERKAAKELEKKLKEQLEQKQMELQKMQERQTAQEQHLKEQQKQIIQSKEKQLHEQLTQKEREMKQAAIDVEKKLKEELERKQEELQRLKAQQDDQVKELQKKQESTIQSKEQWLSQRLSEKEQEMKKAVDTELQRQQDALRKQREENKQKEAELHQIIEKMKQDMQAQDHDYQIKEKQIKEQQQKLVQMKEEELLSQLKRQQEEFKMKTEEQLKREKGLQEAHAKEIQKKEQIMKTQIDQTRKELEEQRKQQASDEQRLLEKQNELLKQQEESMISQTSQQQQLMLESLKVRLEEQYKADLEQRLQQQQLQAEELINEYEQKQQIEIQRLQEMSLKEQEEAQQMMEELLEQKEQERLEAEQQALQRIRQEQMIREQMSEQSSQYLETLKEQLKKEQMEKNEIKRISEETKQLYERQMQEEKEKILKEKEDIEQRMREKELADAAEIERLRKAEQKLKEVQDEKKKRRKEKRAKMKEEQSRQSMKFDKYPDDLASVSTFNQHKQEMKVEKPLFSDSASEAMQPVNLKNQRFLEPEAQTASAQKGFHVQGLFIDDASSAASMAVNKVMPEQKVVEEPERPQKSSMALKSKPKPPTESSKAFVKDFDSREAPKIIESRLSNDKIKQEAPANKARLESMKRDDLTIEQVKQPEKIDYEAERSIKEDSKSMTKSKIEQPNQKQPDAQQPAVPLKEEENEAKEDEFAFTNDEEDELPKAKMEETLEFTQTTQKEAPILRSSRRSGHPLNDTQEEKELIQQIQGDGERAESTISKQSTVSDKRPLLAHLDQIAQKKRLARLRGLSPAKLAASVPEPQRVLEIDEVLKLKHEEQSRKIQEEANKEEEQRKSRELEEAKRQEELRLKEQEEEEAKRRKAVRDTELEQEIRRQEAAEEARAQQELGRQKEIEHEIRKQKEIEQEKALKYQQELAEMKRKEQELVKQLQLAEEKQRQEHQKANAEAQLKIQKEREALQAKKQLEEVQEHKQKEMNDIQEKIQQEVQEAIMNQMKLMQQQKEEEMLKKEQEIQDLKKAVEQEKLQKLQVEKKMAEETEKAREEERQKFLEQESQRQREKEQLDQLLQKEIDEDVDKKLKLLEEEQEWQQIQREKQEKEEQWKQYEKEKDEHLQSLKHCQVQTEKMREELKQLEINKKNRDLVDSAVARIAGEMIICHIENTIQEIYDAEIQSYLNQNKSSDVDDDSQSESNLLKQIEQERKMVEEQRKQIQSFIEHEKQDTEQRQRLSLVEQEQQNILQQKRIQEEQRLLEEKIRNLEIQQQIHDINMQKEQMQLRTMPSEYSPQQDMGASQVNDQHDEVQPALAEEPYVPEKSPEREVKKRRSAMERKQSGGGRNANVKQFLTLDNQEGDWQSSSLLHSQQISESRNDPKKNAAPGYSTTQHSKEGMREHEQMSTHLREPTMADVDAFLKFREQHTESINPFDLAGSCVSRPSRPSNIAKPLQEAAEMPGKILDASSRQIVNEATPRLTGAAADKNWTTDGLNKSREFDKLQKDEDAKQQELFDELGALNVQKRKSINNLDQFEQASSIDSREDFRHEPSNAQSTLQSEDKYPINEQMENQPTINLVINQEQRDLQAQAANARAQKYATAANQLQRKTKPKVQKVQEPDDSFEGVDPSLIFEQDRPPIIFVPRKNNKIDYLIAAIVEKHDLRIPIVPIRPGLYLMGPNRVNLDCKYEQAVVKVGAGTEKLEPYLLKNDLQFRNKLIDYMNKSGKDLKWVVGQLKDGKQIRAADFQEMVVRRQGSGALFSVADSESVAHSRHSKAQKRLNHSDFLNSAASRASDSPSVRQPKPAAQHRVRQFDQLQAPFPARSPPGSSSFKKDSFLSSQYSQSAAQANEARPFKNPKTKGIKLYPGESRWQAH